MIVGATGESDRDIFVPLVRIVRSAYHAACVLFRLCGREYVRPSTSGYETTAVGQGKTVCIRQTG